MPAVTESAAVVVPAPAEAATISDTAPPVPLFRQRNFSALWWGQLVSLLGERCAYLALVALVARHTDGLRDAHAAWLLSLLANVMLAPVLAFAPFAGAWIDRRNLRHVVVTCDLLRAALVMLVPVAYRLTGEIGPVFTLLFLLFTCGVFFLPAKSALTPEIVPATQLLAANTWLTVAGIIAAVLGTLGGGWLVDHHGWALALELNGATYMASVVALLLIRHAPRAHAPSREAAGLRDYARQLGEGWRAIRGTGSVGSALIALTALWWCGGFLHVAGNLHVQHAASRPGMERLAVLFAVLGVGASLGAWWINTAGRRHSRARLLAGAVLVAGAGMLLFSVSTWFVAMAAAALLMGLAAAPILLVAETMLQESTEPGMRGRVFATRDFVVRLVLLVSVGVAAWWTRAWGAREAILLCAVVLTGAGLHLLAATRRARPPKGSLRA